MKIGQWKAEQERLFGYIRDIENTAETEKRDKSPEEVKKVNEHLSRIETLKSFIETEERARAIMRVILPQDGDGNKPFAQSAVHVPREKFRTLGEQLVAVVRAANGHIDHRLVETRAAAGMSEGIPSEGGFLLQEDFSSTLIQRIFDNSALVSRCFRIPLSANVSKINIPFIDETDRATGSRSGGVRGYWLAEAGTKTESKPKLGRLSFEPSKLIGLMYSTDELLQDVAALGALADRWFTLEFDWLLSDAIMNGTGVGQPLGFMNSTALVTITRGTAVTVTFANLATMWSQLVPGSKSTAVWLINPALIPQLMAMTVGGSGAVIPVYLPGQSMAGIPYGTIFGRPVLEIEQCPGVGTTGDIALVDLSGYGLATKGAMQTASSIHVKFTTDETAFRWVLRVDGQPLNPNVVLAAADDTQRSEFVVLDTDLS